ncbi:hypothetical protein KEM55_004996 [Ascosphaera atra]|nr:hypothetical protein KEM55_004996 [Ascosphaera atra]
MINIFHRFEDDKTTWWQYFRRPFYLFAFPNIVLAGIQFAFGCTAGIVTFNTISEIMTEPPYNWAAGPAGLIFLAALVGNFLGMGIGAATDWLIIFLARRNNGYKEPEMRLWAYLISGELVTVLAICSSCINFAISFSIQHFIDRTNYGWAFTFYGILVLLGILAGVPQMIWGKSWRRKCKGRYERFLEETRR